MPDPTCHRSPPVPITKAPCRAHVSSVDLFSRCYCGRWNGGSWDTMLSDHGTEDGFHSVPWRFLMLCTIDKQYYTSIFLKGYVYILNITNGVYLWI